MTIGDHVETLTFAITNIGSSDMIIGFSWLKLHNPLVNWRTGKLCFTNCPSSCCLADTDTPTALDTPVSSVNDGPDKEHVRSLGEYPDTPADLDDLDTIEQDWLNFLMDELKDDDESLLCVDLNKLEEEKRAPVDTHAIRVTDYLRKQRDEEFSPVFTKSTFDQLPPRRSWDHAIELKGDMKPLTSKVYPLSKTEQVTLDEFLEEPPELRSYSPLQIPIRSTIFLRQEEMW